MIIGPVVVAPVIVIALVLSAVTTDDAGPLVVRVTGVFTKAVGNV